MFLQHFFLLCLSSLRFGFVDFDTEENCKAGKDSIEDCEIDGSKVCVAYARCKGVKPPPGAKKSPLTPSAGKPAGQKPKGVGKGGVKGNSDGQGVFICEYLADLFGAMSLCSCLLSFKY